MSHLPDHDGPHLRMACTQQHHDQLKALPIEAWDLLDDVGTQWLPSELPTHEDLHSMKNCGRCRSTLSRIIDSRIIPWTASTKPWWAPNVAESVADWLMRILPELTPPGNDRETWPVDYLSTGPTLANLMMRIESEDARRKGVRPAWQEAMRGIGPGTGGAA